MTNYFTRASKLTGLTQIAAGRDGSLPDRMRDAGIDPTVLRHPEQAIDYGAFCNLLHCCAVAWELPDIGLRMARHQQVDILGPVALIIRLERSVRSALKAITENLVIHSNAIVAVVEELDDSDTVSLIVDVRDDAPGCRENTELILAQAKMVLESIADRPIRLAYVEFRHDKGPAPAAVAAHFGCPVRYGANRNAISFDRAVLDQPIERTDLAYHALIKRFITTTRAEAEGSLLDSARTEVARQMELGTCTLENVAQSLRVSPRGLQRQLKDRGTSFRDLVDGWRKARALALVTHTRLPLSEVSNALGYSEQSVFTQAFRRWYGSSPLRYRAEAGQTADA